MKRMDGHVLVAATIALKYYPCRTGSGRGPRMTMELCVTAAALSLEQQPMVAATHSRHSVIMNVMYPVVKQDSLSQKDFYFITFYHA